MKRSALVLVVGTAMSTAAMVNFSATAHHKPGHNPPGQAKKFKDNGAPSSQGRANHPGGPPPWAPAGGYRGKWIKYKSGGREQYMDSDRLVRLPTVGVGFCDRQKLGTVLGGLAGAAAGSQVGKGDGRILATLTGTILGALVGGTIGRNLDEIDQNCLGQTLERAPTGKDVIWRNADQRSEYQARPTRTFQSNTGQYCRDYQIKVVIDGKTENAVGSACRQPDGSWKRSG